MNQLTVDEQIERVDQHTDSLWMATAIDAIEAVAERKFLLNTDDIWLELLYHAPREPRAMGAAMSRAQKLGMITATNMFQPTKRKASNHRPIRVWKSLIKNGS